MKNFSTLQELVPETSTARRRIADPVWEQALQTFPPTRLPAGHTVFVEGQSCNSYLLVLEGTVRVQRVSASGREIVLYRVGAGESCVLTTCCLLGKAPYPARGVCEGPVLVVVLPVARFNTLLASSPAFREFVFSTLGGRFAELILRVEEVAFGRLDTRLAAHLLKEAGAAGAVAMTHQALATELGTAREVVSRLLKQFERRGWVRLRRGSIEVTGRMHLQALLRE